MAARHLAPNLKPSGRGNERLAPLARVTAQTSGPKLGETASQLWSEIYGQPLTTITP